MKTLEQIQEENRKAIIDANGGDLAIDGPYEYIEDGKSTGYIRKIERGYKIVSCHLAQVLIATQYKFFSSIMSEKESILHIEYNEGVDDPLWIEWNLTKPTLEEQIGEVQRAINKLLTNPNNKESE